MATANQGQSALDGAKPHFSDVIHSPVRLQVCALLDAASAPVLFADAQASLGVTDSHLSKNVRILADAGYVELHKVAPAGGGSRSVTGLSLTAAGRSAYRAHTLWLLTITHATAKGTTS